MSKASAAAVKITEITGEQAAVRREPMQGRKLRQTTGGQWTRGQSGNPNGRPIGSRNLTYRHLHLLMMEQGEAVVAAVLAAALAGDTAAMKLALDRILPRRVCTPIRDVTLPPLRTAADASQALGEITTAVLDGRITADEAAALASLVGVFIKVVDIHDLERRIVELEQRPRAQQ